MCAVARAKLKPARRHDLIRMQGGNVKNSLYLFITWRFGAAKKINLRTKQTLVSEVYIRHKRDIQLINMPVNEVIFFCCKKQAEIMKLVKYFSMPTAVSPNACSTLTSQREALHFEHLDTLSRYR